MKEYYECDCLCGILRIEKDEDTGDFYISTYSRKGRFPLFHKLRHVYKILRYGDPYGDEIILSKDKAKKLANDILKDINR